MRYLEIVSGIRMIVSREEQDLLDLFKNGKLFKKDLDERQREVARQMVNKGLISRYKNEKGSYFTINSINDVWR